MVKAGRWLRNFFFSGKKDKKPAATDRRILPQFSPPPPPPPPSTPKEEEKMIRSFSNERKRHKPMRKPENKKTGFSVLETIAAIKIQACFRSYLVNNSHSRQRILLHFITARKALRALKGLVKLQAAVRGFLVRKQAAAALRSMQALATAQGRARAHRVRTSRESTAMPASWKEAGRGRKMAEFELRQPASMNRYFQSKEKSLEKHIEIEHHVQSKGSSSRGRKNNPTAPAETSRKSFSYQKSYSAPSPPTNANTGARTAHADELSVTLSRSNSQHASTSRNPHRIAVDESGMWRLSHDSSVFPNYMSNTESWKAKERSHSAPRQRSGSPDSRQSVGQRPSFDGKSLVGAAWAWSRNSTAREDIPWAVVLDRSATNMGY